MDSFPKWELPDCFKLMAKMKSVEDLSSLPDGQLEALLRSMLTRTKDLPDTPHKKYLVKLGSLCLQIHEIMKEYKDAEGERKEELKKVIDKKIEEASSAAAKLMVMIKAEEYAQEVVEIEPEEYNDPWTSENKKPTLEVVPDKQQEDEKNRIGEYDPWAVG